MQSLKTLLFLVTNMPKLTVCERSIMRSKEMCVDCTAPIIVSEIIKNDIAIICFLGQSVRAIVKNILK